MTWVTDLGDPAVTIAAAAILFGSLLRSSAATALSWLAAVGTCGAATAAGKLALYAYGHPVPTIWLGSPSGHAAAGVLVYGALAYAAVNAPPAGAQASPPTSFATRLAALLAIAVAGLIAASRVYLGAHSVSDVLVGLAIGGACLAWYASRSYLPAGRPRAMPWLRAGALASVAMGAAAATFGLRLPVDPLLRAIAARLVAPAFGAG